MMGLVSDNSALEITCGCLLLFWMIYLYFVKSYGFWEESLVAHAPPTFPLGSLPKLVLGKWTWAEAFGDLYRRFPGERYAGFFYVTEPCLVIREPDLIKRVLETDFDHFTNRVVLTVSPKDYFAKNLYNMEGDEWKRMKTKLTPAYTVAKMEIMFYRMRSSSEHLLKAVGKIPGDTKEIDSKDLLSKFMVDIIASCAFGNDVNSFENENCPLYKLTKEMVCFTWKRLLKIMAIKSFPIFSKYHVFDFFDPKVKRFFFNLITKAISYREKNNVEHCDYLGMMMKLRLNQSILEEGEPILPLTTSTSSEGLTLEEITSEMHLFILMSHDSTSDTCLFSLYELARHKHVQEKLFAEVKATMDRHVDLTYQALQQMTFMDQVINEVMRLYPVFPVIMRNCTETYKVPDSTLIIPKGMDVYVPVVGLHRDPEYFPEPNCFDPERFSQENCKERHPFVFLPFGAGPRTCMGYRFGLMMVKSALTSIVSRYVIDLSTGTPVPLPLKKTFFSSSPACSVRLRLTPRSLT